MSTSVSARPEIIVPRTERLGDYASVVAMLIDTFADVADEDAMTVYRDLVTADRDVVRVRAGESDDGSVGLDDGVNLVSGARAISCCQRLVQFGSRSPSIVPGQIGMRRNC